MVASWACKRNDSGRAELLAIGSIGCFRYVTELVAESWVSELTRRYVTVFPALTISVSIILAKQPELCSRSFSKSILLTDEPILQSNQHNLFADIASLLAYVAKLQSDVAELFTKFILLAFVAILQPDEPEVSGSEPRLFGFLFTYKSLLADFAVLQPNVASLLTHEPKLLAIEPQLFCTFAAVLIDNAKLQPIEP